MWRSQAKAWMVWMPKGNKGQDSKLPIIWAEKPATRTRFHRGTWAYCLGIIRKVEKKGGGELLKEKRGAQDLSNIEAWNLDSSFQQTSCTPQTDNLNSHSLLCSTGNAEVGNRCRPRRERNQAHRAESVPRQQQDVKIPAHRRNRQRRPTLLSSQFDCWDLKLLLLSRRDCHLLPRATATQLKVQGQSGGQFQLSFLFGICLFRPALHAECK